MKTVLITGASHGIGRSCAELFAHNGMNVVINYNNSEKEAHELEKRLNKECAGINATSIKADISDSAQVRDMFDKINAQFGGVDILVNNAGMAHMALFSDVTDEQRDRIFGLNVYGAMNCTREALPHMIHNKSGSIINISSMWGISGASCEVHYSASKAAVIGFTKALAKELAPSGIRVNCIAPGVIETKMNSMLSDEDKAVLCEETPLGRLGTPDEVAKAVMFFASEESSFITGQVLSVDGGFLV